MTGNGLLDKILVGVNVLIALCTLTVFIFGNKLVKPKPIDDAAEFAELKKDSKSITDISIIKMDKITTNLLSSPTRPRYVDLEVNISLFKSDEESLVTENKSMLIDIIIMAAGEMTVEDINSVAGRILFENRIKMRFNDQVGKNVIKRIFFGTMVAV